MSNPYPSAKSTDPEERCLGEWFSTQRKAYRKGKLSKERIKKLESEMPHWSWTPVTDQTNKRKQQLIEIARKGESRPHSKTKLGQALGDYTCKSKDCYDPEFDNKIRRLAPHWFVDTASENKKQLLEITQKKESRPSQKTKLGRVLSNYTNTYNNY